MHSSKLVAGRYRTVRELGRGGMGVVWLAEDVVIGRRVALKELRTSSRGGLDRVLGEARAAGRLNSPAVVTVHDVVTEHGTSYIVMELVEAPTLADLLRGGPLPLERVAAIGLEVLNALETAHAAGVVHRDVKPGNIMVLPDGRVKLADFGIARALDDPGPAAAGGLMGSPGYMAPELFAGRPPSPATDLWSLGATLFHAAEGRSPFDRESTAATVHAVRHEPPVLDRCTGALAGVVRGLLTQSPANRLTAAQVRRLLAGRARPVEPETAVIPRVVARPSARGRIAVLAVAGAAVVLTTAFLLVPDTEPGRAVGTRPPPPGPTTTTAQATTTTTAEPPPQVTTTTAVTEPPIQTTALTRYRNAEGRHHSGSTMLATPPGFTPEGPMGKLAINAEPDTTPLYSCEVKNSTDRMTSTSPVCEGQTPYGLLGHVFTKQPANAASAPIYRCNAGGHHFDSLDPACEGNPVEFQLGWVLV